MGKRSDFKRRPHDAYDTPEKAVFPLLPFVQEVERFAEPCVGNGYLRAALEEAGMECIYSGDITTGQDALSWGGPEIMLCREEAIITNPPWTRQILHPMIRHFQSIAPTWLLFDADWAHTKQAAPFLDQCSHIVSIGRVKWIEDSDYTGKDNTAWYRFFAMHQDGPRFYGARVLEVA
jgi:hypothetical protein